MKEEGNGLKDEKEKKKTRRRALSLMSRSSNSKGKWHRLHGEKERSIERPKGKGEGIERGMIGLSLEEANELDPSFDDIPLPASLRRTMDYVEEHGLSLEGIYRVSSPVSRLDTLERALHLRLPIQFNDAHEAAGLLKRYLRHLPRPLLPPSVAVFTDDCVCEWREGCSCGAARRVRDSLRLIPRPLRFLLAYIFHHAQNVIANEKMNKMGVAGLGLLLQTILEMSGPAVLLFIMNASPTLLGKSSYDACFLFEDVIFKRLRSPLSSEEVDKWKTESVTGIDEEIGLQERLMAHLHSQIGRDREAALNVTHLEEKLWHVQATQTKLRRKKGKKNGGDEKKNEKKEEEEERILEMKGMVNEKQLLAVHCMLKEDVEEEMEKVARLICKLKGIERKEDDNVQMKKDKEEREIDEWEEKCILEEAARDSLLTEITSLRNDCATLRGEMELNQTKISHGVSTRF